EDDGWDGVAFTDSQSLSGDVFVALGLAAHATSRLKLATGATNPGTRHPAIVASAMATLQVESGGRMVLGIARGDSAMAFIGRKPLSLGEFRTGLDQVQTYLRGDAIDLNGCASRLEWLSQANIPKVPVSVAATGPKVIEIGAQLAERVTFSLGARSERLSWAIDHARQSRAAAGGDPDSLSLGAYVNAVAHPDVDKARQLVRGRLGVYARFSTMHQNALGTLADEDRAVAERLAASYDMSAHATSGARHAATLDDDFVDRFGVVGPSEVVAERLGELASLGLDHLVIVGHGRDVDPEIFAESSRRFGREVIPMLKA
ncbi:MAG TPA: LLM class flavin-dependent oxidoreductase, partial [Chloroflexota bacterium]